MKKISIHIIIVFFLIISYLSAYSQCNVSGIAIYQNNIYDDTVSICLGDTVILKANAACSENSACNTILLESNFNNQTLSNDWVSNQANPVFNNPCQCPFVSGLPQSFCNNGSPGQSGPDSAFAWIGTTNTNERILTTKSFDFTSYYNQGCVINFWMMYGITPNLGSCEDPDGVDEGVHLQYSVDEGLSWNDFPVPNINPVGNLSPTPPFNTITPGYGGYWAPFSTLSEQVQSSLYFWNKYRIPIPQSIKTSGARFRWAQLQSSLAGNDSWGIDNVIIKCFYNNIVYNWSDGSADAQIMIAPTSSKWYYIDIYDNCTANPIHAYDSVYVKIKPVPSSNGIITTPVIACRGLNNIEISVSPLQYANTYNWTYSGSGVSINGNSNIVYVNFGNNTTAGYFTVTATNQCGTSNPSFSSTLYVGQSPQAAVITQIADTLFSNTNTGNHWFNANTGIISGATNQSFIPYITGDYYVKIFENACWSNPSNTIYYTSSDIYKSASDNFNIVLSPNPTSDILTINYTLTENSSINISVTDINGKEIHTTAIENQQSGNYYFNIKTSEIYNGIYFIKFSNSKNTIIKKFIID